MKPANILLLAINENNKQRLENLTENQKMVYTDLENLLFDFKYDEISTEIAIAELITITQKYFKDAVFE